MWLIKRFAGLNARLIKCELKLLRAAQGVFSQHTLLCPCPLPLFISVTFILMRFSNLSAHVSCKNKHVSVTFN